MAPALQATLFGSGSPLSGASASAARDATPLTKSLREVGALRLSQTHAAKLFEAGDLPGALKEIQHVEAASKDVLRLLDELGK
jgi:hypothetical protein